jgi:hypothetical protein
MLNRGQAAPDFPIGDTSLHRMLESGSVVFFFPKASPRVHLGSQGFGSSPRP